MTHFEFSFYRSSDGYFDDLQFSTQSSDALSQLQYLTPPGCVAIAGTHDPLSRRVNLETGHIEEYRPEKPDADHEWLHDDPVTGARIRRWVLKPEIAEQRAKLAAADSAVTALDLKLIRPIQELLLDPKNAAARAKLQELSAEKERIATQSGLRKPSKRDGANE